jgi:predicted Fe-Mo cluster-binding NifX family protein
MKIAVTYDQGMVFQHFGHTEEFKVYTVENNEIIKSEIIKTNGVGHCALGNFLAELEVEVLICGGIGMGAINNLTRAGINIYPGVMGEADMVVEDFIAGILEYNPETRCNHHHDHDHNCGDHHHQGSCHCHDE